MGRHKIPKEKRSVTVSFTITPDVREMLSIQVEKSGLTTSEYLKRLIIEKNNTN